MPTPARVAAFVAMVEALSLAPAVALAAPPPPAPPVEALRQPVDGYDLQTPYQIWRWWVEGQKGAATDAVLAEPEAIDGEIAYGAPILRFTKYNDFGHFLTGEIRVYCQPRRPHGFKPGTCHYRLRRAYVAMDAGPYEGENPVSRWTKEAFVPARVAAGLRAAGFGPDTDWWMADRARLFAFMPSAVAVLSANATVVRLDSRDCPGLARTIEALEGRALSLQLDFLAVGQDARQEPPPAHAVRTVISLRIMPPGSVGPILIDGSGAPFDRLAGPVFDAADACEKAGAGQVTAP
ncbi:MAG: hypothetical protein Q8L23_11835 [Caulobacter sp.]|nr:hypothetical protein [Caulobacter sp.]